MKGEYNYACFVSHSRSWRHSGRRRRKEEGEEETEDGKREDRRKRKRGKMEEEDELVEVQNRTEVEEKKKG